MIAAEFFMACLDSGNTAAVSVTRGDDVVGVEWGDEGGNLVVLAYDHNFRVPEPMDITTNEKGIYALMSFSGVSRETFVPWTRIVEFHGRVPSTPKLRSV